MELKYSEGLVRTGEMLSFIVRGKFKGHKSFSYEKDDAELLLIIKLEPSILQEASNFLFEKLGVVSVVRDGKILIVLNKNVGSTMVKISNYYRKMPNSFLDNRKIQEITSSLFPEIVPPNFSEINLSQEGIVECSQYIFGIVSNKEKFSLLNPVIRNDILELSKRIRKTVAI